MKRLLLHICCAPCSLIPLEVFAQEGYSLAAAYINPNIHPASEYQRRLAAFKAHAQSLELTILEASHETEAWEQAVGCFGGPYPLIKGAADYEDNLRARQARCRQCYRLRFTRLARLAADEGFDHIATTLTISPYQFTGIIFEELEQAAQNYGLNPVCLDFTARYFEATRRSRALGMYRQNYCGCRYSVLEADAERAFRGKHGGAAAKDEAGSRGTSNDGGDDTGNDAHRGGSNNAHQ